MKSIFKNTASRRVLFAAAVLGIGVAKSQHGRAAEPHAGTAGAARPLAQPELQRGLHRFVGLLDYIASDYAGAVRAGAVIAPSEYAEQQSFVGELQTLAQEIAATTTSSARHVELIQRMDAIAQNVDERAEPSKVAAACQALKLDVIKTWSVPTTPTAAPNLARAEQLYGASCAQCHGADGLAQTATAKLLRPAPANFRALTEAGALTPYRAFNTLTFGVAGTAMASFAQLPEDDRWSLAAYVVELGSHGKVAVSGAGSTAAGTTTPGTTTLAVAKRSVQEAAAAAQRGDGRGAAQLLVDGYLDGIEPSEAVLRARDPEGVAALERAFVSARAALKSPDGTSSFPSHATELLGLIERAESHARGGHAAASSGAGATFAFGGGFLILLREGLEAALVVVMLLGMIRRTGRNDALRAVHLGWTSALGLGAVVFALSGLILRVSSSREIMEGVVGLAAATVLFFVSWSLVAQAQAQRWMSFLKRNVEGSLAQRGLLAVFGMAFLAVFREVVETALFYQALALESEGHQLALAAGAVTGVAVMLGLLGLLVRAGRRLDTRRFFLVTGALLYATCVVVAGKSVYALVEAGVLTPHPISYIPTISWLGVHPDVLTLGLQLVLLGAFAVAWRSAHRPHTAAKPLAAPAHDAPISAASS